jgi:hypothetical protein
MLVYCLMERKKAGFLVRQMLYKLAVVAAATGLLTACPAQRATKTALQTSDMLPPVDNTIIMAPLEYNWNTNYSATLMPPLSLRENALAACKERGFDRAYMDTIALENDIATAYFSCRGSDN